MVLETYTPGIMQGMEKAKNENAFFPDVGQYMVT